MLDKLKALQEQKGKIIHEQRSIIDKAESESNRAFTAEERAQFDKHDNDIADIDRKIKFHQAEEADKRAVSEATHKQEEEARSQKDSGRKEEFHKNSFEAYMRGGFNNLTSEQRSALTEGSISIDANGREVRSQGVGSGAAGGYTIPREFSKEFDVALKAYGGIFQMARQYSTGTGATVDWPTFDDTANAAFIIGENSNDANTNTVDLGFGAKQLGAYTYSAGVITISNELMQDTYFNMGSLIAEALATRFGRRQSIDLTTGTGTGQPQGVITGSTKVTGAAATALTADNIIDLIHSVDPAYRQSKSANLSFNDQTLAAIRKLKDNYGQYIWTLGNIAVGIPSQVFGYNYVVSQQIPSIGASNCSVVFGDFSRYIIRRVGDPIVRRLDERYAEKNQVGFVSFMRMDGKLLNSAAIKSLQHAAS